MYKLSIPITNSLINPDTFDAYVKSFREAKVDRVFLTIGGASSITDERLEAEVEIFKRNITLLRKEGFEAEIWVGSTIGHGGAAVGEGEDEKGWGYIRSQTGKYVKDTYCPLDEGFTDRVAYVVSRLATTGASLIQLDDDYRLSQHGSGLCCCCDKHLKRMSEICGEEVTLELINEKVFVGGKNIYRDAWVKAQGDSLREFAHKLRRAVDEIDPSVTLSLCTPWSLWNADGADALELTRILAGDNKPYLRLHGAPYWAAVAGWRLNGTIEAARMFAALADDGETEIFSEADAYPRPRYMTPASYLELFDAALRADGLYRGILKYMYDYGSSIEYETGYVDRHIHDLPALEAIERCFEGGTQEGVRVYVYPHTLADSDFPDNYSTDNLQQSPFSAGDIFAACSIPTTYAGEGICGAAFGENVKYIPQGAMKKGLIIDAGAALILHRQGIDVGIERVNRYEWTSVSAETGQNGERVRLGDNGRFLDADYRDGVEVESYATVNTVAVALGTVGGAERPLAYRYENAEGQRFYVLAVSLDESRQQNNFKRTYLRQKQLVEAIRWISGRDLPAMVYKQPDLYTVAKRKGDDLAVGLFNCFADGIHNAEVCLDRVYSEVRPIVGDARLEGDRLILSDTLHAFSFAAFELIV
ncbi:MAG: hypothetical protein IKM04_01315 [Clostridia bacterium]|nr:hypothetical protein [Clostridia bacterium]